jgi:hypothetical protein
MRPVRGWMSIAVALVALACFPVGECVGQDEHRGGGNEDGPADVTGAGAPGGAALEGRSLDVALGEQPIDVALEGSAIDNARATEFFLEGNAYYAEGRFLQAISAYDHAVEGGFRNADLFYNLANAYYKAGELGSAVLFYERALRLDPTHEDAVENLEFVREQLADRQAPVGETFSFFARLWQRVGTGQLAVLASLFYFLLVGAVILGIARGLFAPWTTRLATVLAVHLVIVLALLGVRFHRVRTVREVIVLATEVGVRTGPGTDFLLEFKLHEGTKVRLVEGREEWLRVSIEGTDLTGWLPGDTVEKI